jgi:hypothetical protein
MLPSEDRRWLEAIELFEATAAIRSAVDRPSEILSERCRSCLTGPPPGDWMRISVLE